MKVLLVTLAIFAAAYAASVPTTQKPATTAEPIPDKIMTGDAANVTDVTVDQPMPSTEKPKGPLPQPPPKEKAARELLYNGGFGGRSSYATYSSYYPRVYNDYYVPRSHYYGDLVYY